MTNPEMLLDTLAGLGVAVTLSETGKIKVHPVSACPGELLSELKENRESVQLYLEQKTIPVSPESPVMRPRREKHPRPNPRPIPVSPSSLPGQGSDETAARVLALRLERGQRADGRYYLKDLQARPGICASCAQWKQSAPGDLLGICPFLDALEIHAAHRCTTPMPRHWTARCAVPASRPPRETISHDATPDR